MSNITMPSGYMDMSAIDLEYNDGGNTLDQGLILHASGFLTAVTGFIVRAYFPQVGYGIMGVGLTALVVGTILGLASIPDD